MVAKCTLPLCEIELEVLTTISDKLCVLHFGHIHKDKFGENDFKISKSCGDRQTRNFRQGHFCVRNFLKHRGRKTRFSSSDGTASYSPTVSMYVLCIYQTWRKSDRNQVGDKQRLECQVQYGYILVFCFVKACFAKNRSRGVGEQHTSLGWVWRTWANWKMGLLKGQQRKYMWWLVKLPSDGENLLDTGRLLKTNFFKCARETGTFKGKSVGGGRENETTSRTFKPSVLEIF